MTVGRRGIASVLVVTILGIAVSILLVAIRVTTPATGTGVRGTSLGFVDNGVVVDPLPGAVTPLRPGDLVTTMDGRPTAEWAAMTWSAHDPAPPPGTVVPFGITRDGVATTVDVPLRAYPLEVFVASAGTASFVVAMLAIGLFLFAIRPRVPATGALLLAGVGAAGSSIPFLLGQDPFDLVTGFFALDFLALSVLYLFLWAGLLDFGLVFPRPLPALVRRPAIRLVPYAVIALLWLAAMLIARVATTTEFDWLGTWAGLSLIPVVVAFGAMPVILAHRWRRADAEDRRVLRGFAYVIAFIIVTDVVVWVIPEALGGRPLLPWSVSGILGLPFPILVAASIVRHRAFDIDVIVRRSLVYGGLTLAVIATYAAAAALLGSFLGGSSGFATSLLATGVAAIVALPVRDVLQRAVSRLLFGDREEPVRAIRRLGDRLELSVDPATMPRTVVDTVADALRLPYVGLELGVDEGARLVAERGIARDGVTAHALSFQGRPTGRLLVAPRGPSDPLTASDLRLLDDLGRQVGVAAHAALLTEDLLASRERIITAREEERRRLRRDLHDGLGPALAGIGMRAGAAEELVRRDPEAAARLLNELQTEASAAVSDIRRLVDGLRPPAIDEVGLVGALRLAADRLDAPGAPDVSIEAPGDLPTLPAAVEVAAYRIGTEALTNAVRHAAAARCSIRLISGDDLTVVVEDDGRGMPAEPRAGVGLASMHERAAEVGGECRIESRPGGGTRVVARLPLSVAPAS